MTQRTKKAGAGPDDAALVKRFQSGEDPDGAIEALFDRYAVATYAFFCRGIGDARLAEELNQELFIGMIKGLRRFRGDSTFKTWLFRLAYHHLSNLRRRLHTHVDEQPAEPPGELWEQLLPDRGGTPEASAVDKEVVAELQRCLARLPELQRAVVLGHYYHGLTLRELTDRLELDNPAGARKHLIAAQRKLKSCMKSRGRTESRKRTRRVTRHEKESLNLRSEA